MLKSLSNPHEYGPCPHDRIPLSEAVIAGGGIVAGRWDGAALADMSMRLEITIAQDEQTPEPSGLLSGRLWNDGGNWKLSDLKIFARSRITCDYHDSDLFRRRDTLIKRSQIINRIRGYFSSNGFLECETPVRVVCPATEPFLRAFDASDGGDKMYLATSPELHLKRMIAAGYEKIFEITHSFRAEEAGRNHRTEFTMLEWYRAWAGLEQIRLDCEEIIDGLCMLIGKSPPKRPFPEIKWQDAFIDYAFIDPFCDEIALANKAIMDACKRAGVETAGLEKPSDILDALFVSLIEPELARFPALFLSGFPACPGALSRTVNNNGHETAGRFELYLGGIEIANAFDELTDPGECEARLALTNRQRAEYGLPTYLVDREFLAALNHGMPPSAGIALGIDRLVMWLTESVDIRDVVAFL
ncbi:MAG: EF-P lysine aminoacylase GenX [Nitrospirae bacterium]|nr:EF-P lysine aminoacylase GenX [Nitrospirota bacterium]